MALPKIESPIFMLDLPSSKETVKYRPFTVKEEKILLMASQTQTADKPTAAEVRKNEQAITAAIEQVISNCLLNDINLNDLKSYDIQYLFVNIRAKSVNNIIDLTFTDDEDGCDYDVQINLDDIQVQFDDNHNHTIVLNDEVSIIMKDPSYNLIKKIDNSNTQDKVLSEMIAESIESILVGNDDVVNMVDHTKKEQQEFIDSFSSKNMRDIEKFFETLPKLSHDVSYTRADGTVVTKVLEGMDSFFT
jgi:hypothetical protein